MSEINTTNKSYRIRSYVPRGRRTPAQERAHMAWWPQFGLQIEDGAIDLQSVFGRTAARYLEIGFGSGQSLLALARARPMQDFIGVETHQPGIGSLFMGIESAQLTNLRVYYADVIDVLEQCIPNASLDGVQIFFPDPWPKRRHHDRRLIQSAFVKLVISKLKPGGELHLATDWQDYATHMLQVVSQESLLTNVAGIGLYADRSPQRPILTKFERRAIREGRSVWELQCRVD